jgi:PAS domain S-box-containing protein
MISGENQKTILLVEDEVFAAMAGKITLEKYGNKVLTAHSGEEAVATVEKTPDIDMILMDINLGAGIDGTEAAEIILKERDLPVLFLSSHSEAEMVARTERITSYGFVVKHSSHTVLDASVKMAFKLFEARTREKEKESQREAALKALRESEARYRTLFENSGTSMIIIEEDATISLVNNETLRRTGYARSEIEGKKKWTEIVDGEDIERMLAQHRLRRENPGEALPGYEFRYRTKSGELRYALINVQLLPGTRKSMASLIDITERKRVESQMEAALEELRRSEEKYRLIFNRENDAIVMTDADSLKFLDVNKAAEKLYGYSKAEFLGMTALALSAEPENSHLTLRAGAETDGVRVPMRKHKRKDGTILTVEISAGPFIWNNQKVVCSIIRDSTERMRTESQREAALEALGESEVRCRELFNRMSSGVAVYEAVDDGGDFIIRDFNPAAEKMEKVSREDVLGKRVSEVFPGAKAFGIFKVFQKVWQTGKAEFYPENICEKEGNSGRFRESWRENWVFKLPAGEIVAIYNDISERKGEGEEIQRQLAEKDILLREVHHRIKNNIASIGGLISLQMQAVTNPEAIEVLQDAIGRVNSMRILYDKLLLTEDYKNVSVKNYVESLIASVVALSPDAAKVTIDQRIADFQLDQKRLSPLGIIINELLTNIMKHAFSNRNAGLIQIALTNSDKRVTLTIQDNGIGLPPGFDAKKSTGFGLILVKMLSQQLEASFSIKKQKGTMCKVEFDI